jgi:HD-GYP domain-containing protein (c-di-GMP phosphodiesterase class II)
MSGNTPIYTKIRRMVIIIVITIVSILALSVYLTYQIGNKEEQDKLIINAFGRQRMVTQLIAKDASRLYALMQSLEMKQSIQSEEILSQTITEVKESLLSSEQKFADSLSTIQNGYMIIDEDIVDIKDAMENGTDTLSQINILWTECKAYIDDLRISDQLDSQTMEAIIFIEENNLKLLDLCEELQKHILNNSLQSSMRMKQAAIIAFAVLLIVLIYALYHLIRFVLLPYKQLIRGITEIGLTDEAVPIRRLTQKNMIPIVGEISEMFGKINNLISLIENINNSSSFMETLRFIETAFSSFVPYNYIGIALINEDRQELQASYGVPDKTIVGLPDNIMGMRWRISETSLGKLLETGEARIINDLEEYTMGRELKPYNRALLDAGIRASITLPLKVSGRPVGVIFFSSNRKNVYHDGHLNFLNTLANSIAISFSQNIVKNDILFSGILALAKLAEARDENTGEHLIRMGRYSRLIAELLYESKYSEEVTLEYVEMVERFSPLHDIGKVAISDRILLKPGKLTKEEFDEMKHHTVYGAEVLKIAEKNMGSTGKSWFGMGIEIAEGHHERWDGTGYPHGRRGKEIPLSARIVAVADVFDALTSRRPYKEAFDLNVAYDILMEGRGKHFDPDIIDLFMLNRDRIEKLFYFMIYEQKSA